VIHVGESDGTSIEVTDGVRAGERVVTRANFLVDSESRLRASLSALPADDAAPVPAAASGHEHVGHGP
jgi:Cu(I)/Ag(I) efflux system membrane fusion protein